MSSDFSINFEELCAKGLIETLTPTYIDFDGDDGYHTLLVSFKDYQYNRDCGLVANNGQVELILSAGGGFRYWLRDLLTAHNVPFEMY